MRVLARQLLIDALGAWGAHEAAGRFRGEVSIEPGDVANSTNLALHRRAPYIARILARQPLYALQVEMDPEDAGHLILGDGRPVDAWAADTAAAAGDSHVHIRRLVDSRVPVRGPLICAAELVRESPALEVGSLVLYDGWHRAAAWAEHLRLGLAYPVSACLVVTRDADPVVAADGGPVARNGADGGHPPG